MVGNGGGAGVQARTRLLLLGAGSGLGFPLGPCTQRGPGGLSCREWGHGMADDLWSQGYHPGEGVGHPGQI